MNNSKKQFDYEQSLKNDRYQYYIDEKPSGEIVLCYNIRHTDINKTVNCPHGDVCSDSCAMFEYDGRDLVTIRCCNRKFLIGY